MADPRWKPVQRFIPFTQPAAGAEIDIVPDTSAGWLIRSLRFTFTSDATVPARTVTLSATDTAREYWRAAAGASQAASLIRTYCGFAGSSGALSGGPVIALQFPKDGLWLPQGHHLATITDAIVAGDQYTNVAANIIEFPSGPDVTLWPFVAAYTEEVS
jgi:hypothetical protein